MIVVERAAQDVKADEVEPPVSIKILKPIFT